jgi:hypothetical protein
VHQVKHPSYVYVMTDNRISENGDSQLVPYVGISRSPLMRLRSQRREPGVVVGHKSTNKGKRFWRMELIVGPFYGQGREFKENWRKKSRKLVRRILTGYWMAGVKEMVVYARDVQWLQQLARRKL